MTTTTKYDDWSTDELGDWFSDYYKDVWNSRPRFIERGDREGLIRELVKLDTYIASLQESKEGRNELRSNGWVINEPSAEDDGWTDPFADMDYIEQYHAIMNAPADPDTTITITPLQLETTPTLYVPDENGDIPF